MLICSDVMNEETSLSDGVVFKENTTASRHAESGEPVHAPPDGHTDAESGEPIHSPPKLSVSISGVAKVQG